ncbi:MAG: hypothetical protein EOP00_29020, partial [Pedobacter sp.]
YWLNEKVELNPGATIETINYAEEKLGFSFPNDFKELYLKVDGFKDWDRLPNMFSIWSLERILEQYNGDRKKEFVCFADYLINSWQICFAKNTSAVFIVYDKIIDEEPRYITEAFAEAIGFINSDSEKIY